MSSKDKGKKGKPVEEAKSVGDNALVISSLRLKSLTSSTVQFDYVRSLISNPFVDILTVPQLFESDTEPTKQH